MKLRKLMIIIILTIFLFSIASVTAANTTEVMTSTDDSTQKNDEIISNVNKEIINDANTGTFAELESDIEKTEAGSTLKLEKNYTCEEGFDTDGIIIGKSITIDGQGNTIDAQGKASIFYVQANNVILKNIIFKNGNSADEYGADRYGGAIYWFGPYGSVSGCSFINNSANRGGAIYWFGDDGSVSGCSFINNSANLGGAIYWFGPEGSVSGCSFINNKGGAIFAYKYLFGDFCWFGNTAENYDAPLPIDGDFNCVHRLFLNATVSSDTLSVFNTSNIIFKLSLYNTTSGNTSEYDNSLFKNLNLSINAVNGNTNTTNIYLEDTVQYMATKGGVGSVTASISTTSFTVYLNNLKIDSNMLVESQEIEYGEEYIIQLKYNVNATGKVNITLKGKKSNLTFSDLDLNNTISLGIIPADEYNVTVIYSGDDSFFNETANGTLSVNKVDSILLVNNTVMDYGTPINVTVITDGVIGIIAKINGKNLTVNGNTIIIPILDVGNYTLFVTAVGDDNHYNVTKNVTLSVNKIDSILLVNNTVMDYGTPINVTVITDGVIGIIATIDGKNLTVNGNTIIIPILDVGNYTLFVTAVGDDNHYNVTKNVTLSVNKVKTQITADAIITTYNIDKDLVITLKDSNGNPVTNATITVDLNGAKTYTTDTNGQVKVSTAGLVPQIYTAKITFAGDNNYNGSSLDVGVTVNKATPILKAKKKTYKAKSKTKKFTIVLKDNTGKPIKNAKVRLMVKKIIKSNKKGGSDKESKADKKKNFAVTNNKGKATFKVLRNKKGKYNAKVKFYSNEYYNKVTKTVKILIK